MGPPGRYRLRPMANRRAHAKNSRSRETSRLRSSVERGQGFKDGGQDVRDFRAAVLAGRVRPARSLLLNAAMGEARVTGDPAGNWKLAKSTQGGRRANARDDSAAAAILAVAEGFRRWADRGSRVRRPLRSAIVG